MGRVGLLAACAVVVWAQLCAVALAATEARIALVIGNGGYASLPRLENPVNDMKLMAGSLRSLGFDVIEKGDADQIGMKRAIQEFGARLEQAGRDAVGLFYYAGHGVQVKGTNYLIPLDAAIEREPDVEIEAVNLDWVLAQMEEAGNRMNILILDACRNNPLSRSLRSSEQGLSRIDAPRGTLIAYATAPGSVSYDGNGQNSPYTEALATAIREPGQEIETTFRKVRVKVMAATNDNQVPWESSSLTGAFEFKPGPAPAPEPATTTARTETPDDAAERLYWESIKDSDNPELFRSYLQRFPEGTFAPIAIARLEAPSRATASLPRAEPPSAVPPAQPAPRAPQPEQQQAALPPALVAPRPLDSAELTGHWEGLYRCQGEAVGMALEVQSRGDQIEAQFEFFPPDGAPSFPTGSFQMKGVFEAGSRRLRLKAGDWIERPWGYQRHDLQGVVQADGRTIEGRILTTGCSQFTLQRR